MSKDKIYLGHMPTSINGHLILKPYKHEGKIRANTSGGFASIDQRSNLVGLELLVDALVPINTNDTVVHKKGSIVYFKEELLYSAPWAKKTFKTSDSDEKFIIAPSTDIVIITTAE